MGCRSPAFAGNGHRWFLPRIVGRAGGGWLLLGGGGWLRGWLPPMPPIVAVAVAVAAGCWLGTTLGNWPAFTALHSGGLIGLAAVLVVGALLVQLRRPLRQTSLPWLLVLAGITAATAGWGWCQARLFPADELAWSLNEQPQPVAVEGWVLQGPRRRPTAGDSLRGGPDHETCQWQLKLTAARHHDQWLPVAGQARVFVDGPCRLLLAGSRVRLFGRGLRPGPALNPGEFDFSKQAQQSRVLSLIRVRDWSCVTLVQPPAWWSPGALVDRLRVAAADRLESAVPAVQRPLVAALLLGRRESLPRMVVDRFAATGTIHILAISGLHVGLLAATLLGVLRALSVSRRPAWAIVALGITLYAAVVGGEVPVVRATILIWTACLAIWVERRPGGLRPLAVAAVGILLYAPASVASVGPQLSFLATAVLLTVSPWLVVRRSEDPLERLIESTRPAWQRRPRRWVGQIARLALAGLAVWLASAPLVAANFHRLAPAAVAINLVVSPLVSLVLSAGLACLLVGGLVPPLGWLAGAICGQAAALLETVVTAAADRSGGSLFMVGPPSWWTAGWYLLLAGLLLSWHEAGEGLPRLAGASPLAVRRGDRQTAFSGRCGRFAGAAGCWLMIGLVVMSLPPVAGGSTRVVCAAMGHGCGILVRSPAGRCLVYDAGRLGAAAAAGRSLSAVLRAEGVGVIDCLVLSHADTDHFNGVPALLQRFRVRQVVVPAAFLASRSATARGLLTQLRQRRISVQALAAGARIVLDQQCVARVLRPPPGPSPPAANDNEQSLVLSVEAGSRRLLLTGDLEGDPLRQFIAAGPPQCDLLVAPHHGSVGTELTKLVQATGAEVVLVSGRGGRDWRQVADRCGSVRPAPPLVLRTAGPTGADRGAVATLLAPDGLQIARYTAGGWRRLTASGPRQSVAVGTRY
jgi:competence protein ComEC